MAFPTNPTDGQTANVNGVVYTYSSALTAWQVTTTFNGNVTVDQISANAVVSVNSVGTYAITATTISASTLSANAVSVAALSNVGNVGNGTSGISIASSGNVTTSVDGNTITVVSAQGIESQFITSPRTILANTTIAANTNAMSAGPITINDGVTVTVASGGEWSVV